MTVKWWLAAPLIDALARRVDEATMNRVAMSAGVDRRTLDRLRHKSRLRLDTADRLSVALGMHPSEVWPNWYEDQPGLPWSQMRRNCSSRTRLPRHLPSRAIRCSSS